MRTGPETYAIMPDMVTEMKEVINKGYFRSKSELVRAGIKRILEDVKAGKIISKPKEGAST